MNSKNTPPTILDIIKTAQPISENLDIDKFADRRVGDFCISDGRIWFMRKGRDFKDGKPVEIPTPLTHNFVSLIEEQLNFDDGMQNSTAFSVIGRHKNGRLLTTLTIQATQYIPMQWPVKHWGALSIVEADQATPRRLANAILILSGDIPIIDIYQYTGWRLLQNGWHYLSGSGAIGATGLDPTIRVDLGFEELANFSLPEPDNNPQTARELFDFLTLAGDNYAVGVSIFACIVRAVLGEAYPVDFSFLLVGKTACGKTEALALAQSAFGKYRHRVLPAGFKDTQTTLTLKSHRIKDSILVIDDIKPGSSRRQKEEKIAKFDYLVEETGDQNSRSRAKADMTPQSMYRPRCTPMITGEYVPDGSGSTLGRLLIAEIKKGDIDLVHSAFLTSLQNKAVQGRYAKAMGNYIQWLAPKMAELKRNFRNTCAYARDEALQSPEKFCTSHSRVAETYAQLKCGTDLYLEYCLDVGAFGKLTAEDYAKTIDSGLKSVVRAQGQFQKDSDEVEIFFSLLRSCFAGGECHVSDQLTQGPPKFHPFVWGWRSSTEAHYTKHKSLNDSDLEESEQKKDVLFPAGQGLNIGNIKQITDKNNIDEENKLASELWLNANNTYKVIQKLATAQNEPLLLNKATLWKRLMTGGKLARVTTSRDGSIRPDCRVKIAGSSAWVLIISSELVMDAWGDDD